ncbi:DUF1345 domain-containing protein [Noviherbaspirillum sp. UKPF54]|uniref:DUF1345 domain-containing protein n=1 Tax=Noviherbaspirillum sp. UKPF54 TaxID=2601898 RepID=UPI0011B139E9|nr:DUF1345 domain-containing protein [Noviherbaspirillum sp. UKPF54]QDZ27849.1 DUF1345 domain-containing protein [Noviherbaspirillum sp. UKPF54]
MRDRLMLLRSHPRLMGSLLCGAIAGFVAPGAWSPVVRMLMAWNVAVWSYLALICWLIAHSDETRMHRLAKQEDNNAVFVLVIMSLGAVLSLAAIMVELASAKQVSGGDRLFHYGLTAFTVFGSWLLVGVIYMFHYAHMFYRAAPEVKPLRFPDNKLKPVYWDFLYFSFTIAVAAQTSDISVSTTPMRKAVLAQSLLSFLFNAAIIGLTINIVAGTVGS